MLEPIANVLGALLQPCYDLTGNWWVALLIFTLLTKVILMPISLWCQKNALNMVQLMPDLNRIKEKYFGDRERIEEEQTRLYKERHYHPLLSLVPLAIQILILLGLIDVVHSIAESGVAGTEQLGVVPFETGGTAWIWPILAGGSAVVLCWFQNRINPLQREQTKAEQNMTNGLSIALALVLGVFVACGLAFYWICSNLSSVLVQYACNAIMRPSKYIDYDDLEDSRKGLRNLEEYGGTKRKWYQRDPLAKREKEDYKRFNSIRDKHLVFYSEASGFYKYYEGTIDYLLNHGSGIVHYVTNDPNDQVFELAKTMPRLAPYYIGQKRAITLMMKMDADVVVTTLQDLDTYYIKRSYVRKDIEYIFMFHHMTSVHMVSSKTAEANYDTVLCTGPHQVAELRRMEQLYELPEKRLVEAGYELIDSEIAAYEAACPDGNSETVQVLVAPSWQEDNILDSCADELIAGLLGHGWLVVVRPHPEYVKRYGLRWQALKERHSDVPAAELLFEDDFSSNETVWRSDALITDWSSIAGEFSFSTLKPSVFIDTPMKVHNPDWEEVGIVPTDITLRSQIGVQIPIHDASTAGSVIETMLSEREDWARRISAVRDGFIFNIGHGAEVSGQYILDAVMRAQNKTGLQEDSQDQHTKRSSSSS